MSFLTEIQANQLARLISFTLSSSIGPRLWVCSSASTVLTAIS